MERSSRLDSEPFERDSERCRVGLRRARFCARDDGREQTVGADPPDVLREPEYFASLSENVTGIFSFVTIVVSGIMAAGALFGALNMMYSAVSARRTEIATLRALGFNTTSVVVSVLAESLALAAIGGAIGGVLAYLAFNGYQTSTMNFSTFSQVAFAFQVSPQLLGMGLFYALFMGLIGGLFPALRAARLPIPSALREL